MAAFTSSEIRRAMEKPQQVARSGLRRFHPRLGGLTVFATLGILSLTAGLFFMLPRTADAAFRHLISHRIYLPGFSNQVTLGQIGEIKTSSRAVMHIRIDSRESPPNLKWRGAALSEFDGRRWFNSDLRARPIRVEDGAALLADAAQQARQGVRLMYRVDLNNMDTDVLFFAGSPERVWGFGHPLLLLRDSNDSCRLSHLPPEGFRYEAYSLLEPRLSADEASRPDPAFLLPAEIRNHYLQLPPALDSRVAELARTMAAGEVSSAGRARALEHGLRTSYGYTLELPKTEERDPLTYFLFTRKKGHCEYFASAMTVMLRTLGIPSRLVTGFQSGTLQSADGALCDPRFGRALVGGGLSAAARLDDIRSDAARSGPAPRVAVGQAGSLRRCRRYVLAAVGAGLRSQPANDAGGAHGAVGPQFRVALGGAHRVEDRGVEGSAPSAWFRRYGGWLLAGIAGSLLAAWFAPRAWRALHMLRRVRLARRGQASVDDATLLYRRMLELLKRRGYQKPAWFTPHEFAASLPRTELGMLVDQFTEAYNALRFGGRVSAAPQLSLLLERLEQQR